MTAAQRLDGSREARNAEAAEWIATVAHNEGEPPAKNRLMHEFKFGSPRATRLLEEYNNGGPRKSEAHLSPVPNPEPDRTADQTGPVDRQTGLADRTADQTGPVDRQTGPVDRQTGLADRTADQTGPVDRQTGLADRTADQTGPVDRQTGLADRTADQTGPVDRTADQTGPVDRQTGPVDRQTGLADRTADQTGPADRQTGPADRTADQTGPADRQTGPADRTADQTGPADRQTGRRWGKINLRRSGPGQTGPDRTTGPPDRSDRTDRPVDQAGPVHRNQTETKKTKKTKKEKKTKSTSGARAFYLVSAMAFGMSADTSYRFFRDIVGITNTLELSLLFAVVELLLVAAALAMRDEIVRRGKAPSVRLKIVTWGMCVFAAYAAYEASNGNTAGAIGRIVCGPIAGLIALHYALGIDGYGIRPATDSTIVRIGRELRERFLSVLGLGDDQRDALTRSRARAARRAARLANGATGKRKLGRVRAWRLNRALRSSAAAHDTASRQTMIGELAALQNAGQLLTVNLPAPWELTTTSNTD